MEVLDTLNLMDSLFQIIMNKTKYFLTFGQLSLL